MNNGEAHVVSIPPGVPFLSVLVDNLLNGDLIEGFKPLNDPLALSTATIWVPTRRAIRALSSEFLTRFDGEVALLPSIRALGDVDEDELGFIEGDETDFHTLGNPIGSLERQIILSRLVHGWAEALNPDQRKLYQGDDIIMPSSLGDAVWFAADLARLMDTVATEEADWASLETLVPDDHAEWWKLTLEFLQIATKLWPDILLEKNLQDGAVLRAKMLRKQAMVYAKHGSSGPVIAAGSTGSIPATADLLKTISRMSNGVVVLPGLDRDLDNETWQKIDLPDNDQDDFGSTPGHPQYGLKKLIHHMGVGRETHEIEHLRATVGEQDSTLRVRETLVSEALRPSDSTSHWQGLSALFDHTQISQAFAGVSLIEAAGEREEALCIALALRETLEDRTKTAALVTPDRNLARRVAVEMRRFGVAVDDSAGTPLRNTPAGSFLKLVLRTLFLPADPIALASLIKHPKALFGDREGRSTKAARLFELTVLRGAIVPPPGGQFLKLMGKTKEAVDAGEQNVHRSVRRLSPKDWDELAWFCRKLDQIFARQILSSDEEIPFSELARESVMCLELCGAGYENDLSLLYENEDGRALSQFLTELLTIETDLLITREEWPAICEALIAQKVTRLVGGTHPRVSILGPLEARLQTFDRVVLGGLNEKSWPAPARNDAFLSRPMKVALGLPPPERRTGLAAHDFQTLLGMKDVVLSRSLKMENAPSVASRWVQRVGLVVGETVEQEMRQRGNKFLAWARHLDQPSGNPAPCSQPKPAPPVETRPSGLSITEIETWISDPYAIYAKHILKLNALSPLIREADMRERGTLYHAIFEDIIKTVTKPGSHNALDEMIRLARNHFDESGLAVEHTALWWPRTETIIKAFHAWHKDNFQSVDRISVELLGRTQKGLDGFTLSGRVDRIDFLKDGGFNVIDYKTGKNPTLSKVKSLQAPQLPLSAAMVIEGAFDGATAQELNTLSYVRLRPTAELEVDTLKQEDANKAMDNAWQQLRGLIKAYRDPKKAYWSKARIITDQNWESDYDHLARVLEWSSGTDPEGTD